MCYVHESTFQHEQTGSMTTDIDSNPSKSKKNLAADDWLRAARRLLIENGIDNVRVRRLAEALGVTTGAFYWQFDNLDALHADLLKDWEERNTDPFVRALGAAGDDGRRQLLAYYRIIMLEEQYNPAYDNAVRDWSEKSSRTMAALRRIDARRVRLIRGIFLRLGFSEESAEIRARVQYYHQVGYQAMRVEETLEERLRSAPLYAEILTNNAVGPEMNDPQALHRLLLETPLH